MTRDDGLGGGNLIDLLHHFNRKERFLLLRWVVGGIGERVPIHEGFRVALEQKVGTRVPPDAAVFTDYHLDWLYAALCLHANTWDGGAIPDDRFPTGALTATQEDIDLLVAWPVNTGYRLALVEAKAYSGFADKPLARKAKRLGVIFGQDGRAFPDVEPSFLLTAFKPPPGIHTECWPPWLLPGDEPSFLELPWPKRDRFQVERCDADGNSNKNGKHRQVKTGWGPPAPH